MADTPQYPTARKRKGQAKSKANGANLGFEEKLWLTADKLRGRFPGCTDINVFGESP